MENRDVVMRIKMLIEKKEMSPSGFAKIIGFNQSNLSKILRGERDVPTNLVNAICDTLNVPYRWLVAGEGDMLTKGETDIVSAKLYLRENLVNIPYVPIDAKASFVESLYDTTYDMDFYGVMPEDGEDLISGGYVVFQIKGDSMSPNIPNSSKVLARKIPEGRWETASGVIVIVYGKTLTIKRILKNSLFGGNSLTLKADNPEYGQFEVERKEIRGMWQAIRIVSKTII